MSNLKYNLTPQVDYGLKEAMDRIIAREYNDGVYLLITPDDPTDVIYWHGGQVVKVDSPGQLKDMVTPFEHHKGVFFNPSDAFLKEMRDKGNDYDISAHKHCGIHVYKDGQEVEPDDMAECNNFLNSFQKDTTTKESKSEYTLTGEDLYQWAMEFGEDPIIDGPLTLTPSEITEFINRLDSSIVDADTFPEASFSYPEYNDKQRSHLLEEFAKYLNEKGRAEEFLKSYK